MASITSPTVEELSALMRARTRGEFSDQGVFNAQTRPTDAQAQDMLDLAMTLVTAKVGTDVDPDLADAASAAVKFKAATLVEATYYPEQANADDSAYSLWQGQYEELMATFDALGTGNTSTTPGFGSLLTLGRDGAPYDPTAAPADPWFP